MGLRSGEYGGHLPKIAFALMSSYSIFFSSSMSLTAFLCHGALSTIMANIFPSSIGLDLINSLKLSIVVLNVNHSGADTNNTPVSGLTKPL